MAKRFPDDELNAIEKVVAEYPEGLGLKSISELIDKKIARRTLQRYLKHLVDARRLAKVGEKRGTQYRLPDKQTEIQTPDTTKISWLSQEGKEIQKIVLKPMSERKQVGYERSFLDSYIPNQTFYISKKSRDNLKRIGSVENSGQPAGTYARKIMDRLLIDLSWNSSRLEGNKYSLLDTKELLDYGKEAVGKDKREAQMILNHKDAIEFLVESADNIGFNRYTILNLHGLLANNLLNNPSATGRLRHIEVGVDGSVFNPLAIPQLVEECFVQILEIAKDIEDPFEQSFFIMVHLPYLQPFDDVNKRVSRLAANIPLIKANLVPLAFPDIPKEIYTQGILGVYELNRIELLRDVFLYAYQRSVDKYAAVRQSLGDPDPFRLEYREPLKQIVRDIVLSKTPHGELLNLIDSWMVDNVVVDDRGQFREVAETELNGLHEGNIARYRIRLSEFQAWHKAWKESSND